MAQYKLGKSVVAMGAVVSSNQQYSITGTLGQPLIGASSGGQFSARFGFWYNITPGGAVPTVETHELSNVRGQSAVGSGTVVTDGGLNVTERGLVWSVNPNPLLNLNESGHSVCGSGLGFFQSVISGLSELTTYYVKSYATNALGTSYGREISFTTKDETPPFVACNDIIVTLDEDGIATIASSDLDGGCSDMSGLKSVGIDRNSFDCSNLGSNYVMLTATDNYDNSAYCTAEVMVIDNLPPAISVILSPATIWPPNNKMTAINASVTVNDNCPGVKYMLTSITSNENITDDVDGVEFNTPDAAFRLRAKRNGGGVGRTYFIKYIASDISGNKTEATAEVEVPHDLGRITEPSGNHAVAGEFEAKLGDIIPNPFSASAEIEYFLSDVAAVRLYITDITGRPAAVIFDGESPSGWNVVGYDTEKLTNGTYFLCLETQNGSVVKLIQKID